MNKNDKLLKLLRALKLSYEHEQPSVEAKEKLLNCTIKQKIYRVHVRRLICGELELSDRHSVTTWLDRLIDIGALAPNPTSEFQNDKFMPNANTKYFIEIDTINTLISKFNPPHTLTLDNYNSEYTGSTHTKLTDN